MSKVIICANQKGGVAKTTTTLNVGIGLAGLGKRYISTWMQRRLTRKGWR